MRRVAVTGLGTITPIGTDCGSFWEGIKQCRSGGKPIQSFDSSGFPVHFACEVTDFDPNTVGDRREIRRLDRFSQFALGVAQEAFKHSGFPLHDEEKRRRTGCIFASGIGGIKEIETVHSMLLRKGPRAITPFLVPKMMTNAAAGQIAIRFGLKGPNFAVTSACASGSHAIITGYLLIASGQADAILAGGAEAAVTPLGIGGFCAAKALSRRNDDPATASRPFSADRDGFVVGEGAGTLLLEEYEQAKARGAKIFAELAGVGMTDDAYHITAPSPDAEMAAMCMENAVKSAGIQKEDVDYINAHGTSTRFNDKGETNAIKKAFAEHAYKLAVSSTKSQIGHLLGASGAVETVATCLALEHQLAPATINYTTPDPECDLDYVPNATRPMKVDHALSNSFGFGGHNGSLLFSRP